MLHLVDSLFSDSDSGLVSEIISVVSLVDVSISHFLLCQVPLIE